jgi:putative transposase
MSVARRHDLIAREHPHLAIVRQCELVSISRSGFYYAPVGASAFNLTLMRLIDEQFMETPFYGARQMARHLRRCGYWVGRHCPRFRARSAWNGRGGASGCAG